MATSDKATKRRSDEATHFDSYGSDVCVRLQKKHSNSMIQ